MVDQQDPTGANLRDALDGLVKRDGGGTARSGNFLLVFYERDCVLSNRWFGHESIMVQTHVEGEVGLVEEGSTQSDVFEELCNLVKIMKGDRVRISSTCMPHS